MPPPAEYKLKYPPTLNVKVDGVDHEFLLPIPCQEHADISHIDEEHRAKQILLDIARELERVALEDEYFVKRNLYPNVDFYSGILYRAMGIPTNMFTVMFAIGRLPGWLAHWQELREDDSARIYRPRQIYTGPTERNFSPLNAR